MNGVEDENHRLKEIYLNHGEYRCQKELVNVHNVYSTVRARD